MSQVRKFYKGGKSKKTPVNIYIQDDPEAQIVRGPKSQGTFTIDGKTYSGEDLADDLERTGAMYSPSAENVYRSVAEAVRNGQHVIFDSKNNVISGMDGKWGISERANDRLSKTGRSGFANGLGTLFHSEDSKVRDNLRYLGQYVYRPKPDLSQAEAAPVEAAEASAAEESETSETNGDQSPQDTVEKPTDNGGYTQDQLDSIGGHWDAGRGAVVVDDPEHIWDGFSNRNYRFNDLFFKRFTDPKYTWLKDKIMIDGVLYNASDADKPGTAVYNFLRTQGGYRDIASNLNYAGANELMENLWGNDAKYEFLDNHLYSNILSKANRGFQDVSNRYDLSGYAPGSHIVRYLDVDPSKSDSFGEYALNNYIYRLLDEYGNDAGAVDITKLNPNARSTNYGPIGFRELLKSNDSESPYNNRYVTNTNYYGGDRTGTYFFVNPNDPDDLIMHMDEFEKYNVLNGGDIRLPRQIAHIFLKNPNLVARLNADRVLRDNFAKWLAGMFKTVGGRIVSDHWFGDGAGIIGARGKTRDFVLNNSDWNQLGFDMETKTALEGFYHDFVQADQQDRQNSNIVHAPEFIPWNRSGQQATEEVQSHKSGGRIQRLATGDILGSGAETKPKENETKASKPIRSSADEATTSDVLHRDLTEADKWDLGALAADVASLALSFTGVGSLGAAGVGAAGSLARFTSDIKRDGFQWGDAGSLVTNLGMDALTAIPGLGTAGKIGKLTKTIRASAPLLLKALRPLAIAGTAQGAYTVVKKIVSGDELTIRDWSTLANGLTAAVALNRTGLRNPVKKGKTGTYKAQEFGEYNGKKLSLSEAEMKTLAGKKTAKERMDFAAEKLTEKANADLPEGATRATKGDLLEFLNSDKATGITTRLGLGHEGWKPKFSSKDIETTEVVAPMLRKEYSNNTILGRIGNLINGRGKTIGGRERSEINYLSLDNKTKNKMVDKAMSKTYETLDKTKADTLEIRQKLEKKKNDHDVAFERLNRLINDKKIELDEARTSVSKAVDNTKFAEVYANTPPSLAEDFEIVAKAKKEVSSEFKKYKEIREQIRKAERVADEAKVRSSKESEKINQITNKLKQLQRNRNFARSAGRRSLENKSASHKNFSFTGWMMPAWNNLLNPEKPGNRRADKTTAVGAPAWRIGVVQPSFKKGGIIKAAGGSRDITPLPSVQEIDRPKYLVNQSWDPVGNQVIKYRSNYEIRPVSAVDQNISLSNYDALKRDEAPVGYKQYLDNIQESLKTYQYGNGNASNMQGGKTSILDTIDPSNIIDAGNFAAAMRDSRRQYDNIKNYHANHVIAPTLITPRLQLNTGDALRQTILNYKKPTSSDAFLNSATQQGVDQQNIAIAQKANLADAQQYAQYNTTAANTYNQQAQLNANAYNQNVQTDDQVELNRIKATNQYIAQNSNIRNQHLVELAKGAHDRYMAQNQANAHETVWNETVSANNDFNNSIHQYKDAYAKWSKKPENIDADTKQPKRSFNEWLQDTGNIYDFEKLQGAYNARLDSIEQYNNLRTNYGTTFGNNYLRMNKSGGKITKVDATSALSDFTTQAKMLIESGKITSKFISDLNKVIQQAKKNK